MRPSRVGRYALQSSSALGNSTIRPTYGPFIGGREVQGEGESIPVENPATGEILCHVQSPSSSALNAAVNGADAAFRSGIWSQSAPAHRAKVLSNVARVLEKSLPDLILLETLQTGRCIREMRAQLGRVPEWLDYAASIVRTHQGLVLPTQGKLLNYVKRVPLGVVAQITPFNHPLLIAMKKIAPALAAGNTLQTGASFSEEKSQRKVKKKRKYLAVCSDSVIVKPSELAPISVLLFAELATEAGIPPSVLNVLLGRGATIGKELVSHKHIRKVDITAGTETGKSIGRIAGEKLVSFTAELGGKAPILVFSDADIPTAVAGVCFSAFVASGQTCVSGTRLLVQEDVYEQFMAALREKVVSITGRIGSPLNTQSMMGPVISDNALQKIFRAIEGLPQASRILVGGERMRGPSALDDYDLSKGYFFPPTIVENVHVEDTLWQEELFGPVLAVAKFKTDEEAVRLANNSRYALGAGLWTADLGRAHRVAEQIEAGIVWINTWHRNDPSSPWGGMKDSGLGRENGVEAFESYTQSKSTVVNIADVAESRRDDWFAEEQTAARYG